MKIPFVLVAFCAAVAAHGQPVLRLRGSTTVEGALRPKLAQIQAQAGVTCEVQALGSASGLKALAAGTADIAMVSDSLDELVHRIDGNGRGKFQLSDYHAEPIGEVRLVFIVNPHNPVRHLTDAQLIDVLSGKVRNWHDVGGGSQPIVVVSLANAGPLVQEKLMHGTPIAASARQMPTAAHIPVTVAQEPGAIGIVSSAHRRANTTVIATDADVHTPLLLVTLGDPSPAQRRLIDAARTALADVH